MSHEYTYTDGRLPGGRYPVLYLARAGEAVRFAGLAVPGWCAITGQDYKKAGQWSSTTYRLLLAPGVRALELVSPLHNEWGHDLPSWGAVAECLGLPVEVARGIVRTHFRTTAERLDAVEAFAAKASEAVTETVTVSFGSPTRRQIQEGYWSLPKSAKTSDGRTVTVAPGPSGWGSPTVVEPEGARVVDSRHTPGMNGGYWTVEVAIQAPTA
jgi:hypothetical protein